MGEPVENTLQPPEWMTKDFLQDCLRRGGHFGDLQILDCKVEPAVGVGDNYASCMFRVSLRILQKGKDTEKRIIVKSLPLSPKFLENVRNNKLFYKESEMLRGLLPDIHNSLRRSGDFSVLSAEAYYDQGDPENLIIMEDLCASGFRGGDRFNGLDVPHCELVMKNLGIYHAGTLAVLRDKPELKEKYKGGMWEEGHDERFVPFFKSCVKELIENVDSWSDKKYAAKLEKLVDPVATKVYAATRMSEDCLNVINHGDLWTNNMMFRYSPDNTTPSDLKFVDFQQGHYNSPVMDLLYFMFTSPRNDVRIPHLESFLQTYHTSFTTTCSALNLDVQLSFDDLRKEFLGRLMFGFIISIFLFPIFCAPTQDTLNAEEVDEETGAGFTGSNILKNNRYVEGMLEILPYLEANGIF